jgi:membrane fusion protein, multidrug efflux system
MTPFRCAIWLIPCLLAAPGPVAYAEDTASVAVQTQPPHAGAVPDVITAYGSAAPALDGGMTLSLQQEGRVLRIAVAPGEMVHTGQALLDFGASAAAVATYQQAINAREVARTQRIHVAQLLQQQLATRDQLGQADKALADAQAALDALQREGADRATQTLTAPFDGVVATIPVAPGNRVPAGTPLLTLTRLDGLVVTVGIEPDARNRVRPGQKVHLVPLGTGVQLDGQVLRVNGVLDPRTRLIDADVSVPAGAVISGATFRVDITVGQLQGWIVPHDAVINDDTGAYVFQVVGNTASRVAVTVAGTAGNDDVVDGKLDPQRPLVVQGNYQLSDHTAVRVSGAS